VDSRQTQHFWNANPQEIESGRCGNDVKEGSQKSRPWDLLVELSLLQLTEFTRANIDYKLNLKKLPRLASSFHCSKEGDLNEST
jgi:hypothetical protein